VDYTLGSIVPRLDLVYFLGGTPNPASYHRVVAYSSAANNNNDFDVFSVRPSGKFNIDAKTFIEIGDVIYYTNLVPDTDSVLTNVFYVDFKWSF
jgi:hypothetical protein